VSGWSATRKVGRRFADRSRFVCQRSILAPARAPVTGRETGFLEEWPPSAIRGNYNLEISS
jgi:hypothetical protein